MDTSQDNLFRSAGEIMDNVMANQDQSLPPASRPSTSNRIRNANRVCQRLRPTDPRNLDFEVISGFINPLTAK